MCCIFSCCVWTIDVIQRVLTFLLACVLAAMVVLILAVAIVVGVAYGYNYSMAEFIALGKSDVTVYMRRGQFSDAEDRDSDRPPVFPERRQFENIFSDGSPVDINNLIPDAAGKARLLADSWEQAKEARKYDGILSKFTPQKGIGHKKESKESRSSQGTNFLITDNHEKMFFDEENRAQDYFYMESTKSKSVTTKQEEKSLLTERRIIDKTKPLSAILFDEEKRGQDDFYLETSKFIPTTIYPSKKDEILNNLNRPIPTYFNEKNRGQDIFYIDSTKSESVTIKMTSISTLTQNHIMEKFKPVYIEEDNQELYNPQKETQIVTIKTTKKWSSTERRALVNFKTTSAKKINRKPFSKYNNTTKSKKVTLEAKKKGIKSDIRIPVQNLNFNTPENKKHIIPEQNYDEIEDYSDSEEEDRMLKPIQKEKEKSQQSGDKRMPDVKIRVGNVKLKTRTPDVKIRVESQDYYESDKYNQKNTVKPPENKDYEEQMKIKYFNEKFKTGNKSRIPDIIVQIQSKDSHESDKKYMETDVEPLEKESYKELINKKDTNDRLDGLRTPDMKIRLQSKDYNKSNEDLAVLPLEKDNYGPQIHRKPLNERFQTVYKLKTTVRMRSKDYNELDKNNKNNVVVPMDEEDYDERFDRKNLSWKFRTVDRIKFDDGATHHPYKMQQPPHPYREEDDDVMYKPV